LIAHAAALYVLIGPAEDLSGEVGESQPIAVTVISSVPVALGAQEVMDATTTNEVFEADLRPADPSQQRSDVPMPQTLAPPDQEASDLSVAPDEPPHRERDEQQRQSGDAAAAAVPLSAAPASAGAIREYAKRVSTILAKTKPRGRGALGTARIRFTIARSGRASGAIIVVSSGALSLDHAALSAVERTEFPVPPEGMTPAQLTFEVPYHFR
jgi:TonB family protein